MAKKEQPPSVTPERGIELLRRQKEKGEELLAARPLHKDTNAAWYNTTVGFLLACFGSDSHNLQSFGSAGGNVAAYDGATEKWWEQYRAKGLEARLKILGSCIEQLEAEVEPGAAQPSTPGRTLDFDSLHPMVIRHCVDRFEADKYDDAIHNAFVAVEDKIRTRIGAEETDLGVALVNKAMNPKSPRLVFSKVTPEQEAACSLYRGAIGYFKNPRSHRFLHTKDPDKTLEVLAFASLLLRMLDEATLEEA